MTRTFPVELVLPNQPEHLLRDGLVVRAALELGTHSSIIALPRDVVLKRSGSHSVFVVEASIARQRPVTIGSLIDDQYIIEAGLQPGELVVTAGMQNLTDGAHVIVEAHAPAHTANGEDPS